jgi:hypothetical protein
MYYVVTGSTGLRTLKNTEESFDPENLGAKLIYVDTVADLQAAVTAQTAGQFIVIMPGEYVLTASLTIPLLADGGGLIGMHGVTIEGAAAVDQAILIATADATGTFEYTLKGDLEIGGGHDKIGLKITNGASTQKTIVYFEGSAHCIDNGTGVAVSCVNTGTGAVRLYVNGTGQGFDTINITPKVADDRFYFTNISFDETFTAGAAAVACYFKFVGCELKENGMAGGHATQVWSAINCYTVASGVSAIPNSTDFPGITADAITPAS